MEESWEAVQFHRANGAVHANADRLSHRRIDRLEHGPASTDSLDCIASRENGGGMGMPRFDSLCKRQVGARKHLCHFSSLQILNWSWLRRREGTDPSGTRIPLSSPKEVDQRLANNHRRDY